MQPTDHPCPDCGAPVGARCKNYQGKGKQPCRSRVALIDDRVQARLHARAAKYAAKENKQAADDMPLFAGTELLPQVTATDAYNRKRRLLAFQADMRGKIVQNGAHGVDLLSDLHNRHVERIAARLIGCAFTELYTHCRHTYPSSHYWVGFWRGVLTGKRVELAFERVENRQPGEPAIRCTRAYQCQHMNSQEFDLLFPAPDTNPRQEPDALAAKIDCILEEIKP